MISIPPVARSDSRGALASTFHLSLFWLNRKNFSYSNRAVGLPQLAGLFCNKVYPSERRIKCFKNEQEEMDKVVYEDQLLKES